MSNVPLSERFAFCPACGNGQAQGHERNCAIVRKEKRIAALEAKLKIAAVALELLRDLGAKARNSWECGRTVNADRVVEECETALEEIGKAGA